jgi:hypothetical protein
MKFAGNSQDIQNLCGNYLHSGKDYTLKLLLLFNFKQEWNA